MGELGGWIEEWGLELRAGSVSPGTVLVYLRCARRFAGWLEARHPTVTTAAAVTRSHCQGWLRHLAETGRSDATRRVRGIALRLFLGYVAAEADSGLTDNPAAKLDLPVPTVTPVPVLHDADLVDRVMTSAHDAAGGMGRARAVG